MDGSDPALPSEVLLARWTDRFIAWLIDYVLISSLLTVLLVSLSSLAADHKSGLSAMIETQGPASLLLYYAAANLAFFAYWVALEYVTGQSIGKKMLDLRVTDANGGSPDLKGVAISSFGKSFLLPFDVLMGLFLANDTRQRMFNKLGNTLVVKRKSPAGGSGTRYARD